MSIWVRNKRGRLENFETYFGNLFDTPLPSPYSSIMCDETHNNHEENRRTMYELLHPTQNSVPSCIMFPLNAPHVELKQGKQNFLTLGDKKMKILMSMLELLKR